MSVYFLNKVRQQYKSYTIKTNKYDSKSVDLKDKNWPTRYRAEFIEPGICSYEDLGMGVIFVGAETLDKMNKTFIGKPVVNVVHKDLAPERAFKVYKGVDWSDGADGVVYDSGKLSNGWYYCDMIIWSEETKRNIKNGFTVSCAYIVEKAGPEGKYHEIKYDESVQDGYYTHMCITNKPRYEGVKLYELPPSSKNSRADEVIKLYINSKGDEKMALKNIFKHFFNSSGDGKSDDKGSEGEDKNKNVQNSSESLSVSCSVIEVEGQEIPLEEAINAYKELRTRQNQSTEEKKKLKPDDQIEIDGEQVNVSDLIAACGGVYKKKNSEMSNSSNTKVNQGENSTTDQNKQATNQNNEGEKFFKILKNAVKTSDGEEFIPNIDDKEARLKRGEERYGKKEVVK